MRRTLSSLQTIPIKLFFPLLWIFALGLAVSRFFVISKSADRDEGWVFVFILLFITASVWPSVRLKVISVDDHNLNILNYTKEIAVPLSEILNVTQSSWLSLRGESVTIYLRSPSEFGNKIEFLPKARLWAFGQHPVVRELKSLAAKAPSVATEPTME